MKKDILVGAHVSIAGGLHQAIYQAESIGATSMQIFVKNARSWHAKPLSEEEIALFTKVLSASTIQQPVAHASYLINIGSPDHSIASKSTKALLEEFERCQSLGIPYLVLHPGSHVGSGEDACLEQIAHNLHTIFETSKRHITTICLEAMAGQGSNVGYSFEHLKKIISLCGNTKRLGVCLDTCHIFAAGYDISTADGYKQTIKLFDDVIGLERLKVIHMNGSLTACNSHKDRHAPLGEGEIPLETFVLIMRDSRFKHIPKILETPHETLEGYAREIVLLKEMVE